MAYAEYSYYVSRGGEMSESEFNRYAERASDYIDSCTYGRINADVLSDEGTALLIAKACCECADIICEAGTSGIHGAAVASETVGEYSVTYATDDDTGGNSSLYTTVKEYLGRTGLMYRGTV